MKKILIVEDQSGPLEALESAVKRVAPKYFPELHCDTARCYEDAQRMIQDSYDQDSYDIVLLDHRMPIKNTGDLEDTDFQAFSNSLRNAGYSLIDEIKRHNSRTVVIGTSSLPQSELGRQSSPDYTMSKQWG